jgi:endo-1,4-beta-xylanase
MTNNKCEGWGDENLKKQGKVYGQLLKVCLKAPNCESFETWGFTDRFSCFDAPMNALPFDKDFKKKKAYW